MPSEHGIALVAASLSVENDSPEKKKRWELMQNLCSIVEPNFKEQHAHP